MRDANLDVAGRERWWWAGTNTASKTACLCLPHASRTRMWRTDFWWSHPWHGCGCWDGSLKLRNLELNAFFQWKGGSKLLNSCKRAAAEGSSLLEPLSSWWRVCAGDSAETLQPSGLTVVIARQLRESLSVRCGQWCQEVKSRVRFSHPESDEPCRVRVRVGLTSGPNVPRKTTGPTRHRPPRP